MNENNNTKYEVIARYIKDVSFEIPTPEAFVDAAKNLGSYITKIDFKSNPYKGNLVELNCKLIIEAPENIKNKMRSWFYWGVHACTYMCIYIHICVVVVVSNAALVSRYHDTKQD